MNFYYDYHVPLYPPLSAKWTEKPADSIRYYTAIIRPYEHEVILPNGVIVSYESILQLAHHVQIAKDKDEYKNNQSWNPFND